MTNLHYKILMRMIEEVNNIFKLKIKGLNFENLIIHQDIKYYLENGIISENINKLINNNNISHNEKYFILKTFNNDINNDIDKFIEFLKIRNTHVNNIKKITVFRQLLDYNIFENWKI